MRLPDWWEAAMSTGKVAAALSWSASPAWIPPMSGSARRSTTGRPRRSPTISPTARSPKAAARFEVGEDQVPGHPEGLGRAEDPRSHQRPPPGGHSEVEAVGHRSEAAACPDGGTRRPHRDQRSGEAELAHSSVASGRRARKASAATSTRRPAKGTDRTLPPRRSAASSTMTSGTIAPAPATTCGGIGRPAPRPRRARRSRPRPRRRWAGEPVAASRSMALTPPRPGGPPRPARRGSGGRR